MTTLEKNLITLQEKIYGLNFDISKSFLPDSEVAKLIMLSKNAKMTKADADIMIDGKISETTKISIAAEIRAKLAAQSLAKSALKTAETVAKSAADSAKDSAQKSLQAAKEAAKTQNAGNIKGKNLISDSVGNTFTTENLTDSALENVNSSELKSIFSEDVNAQVEQEIENKERIAEFAKQNGIYPLPKDSPYHTEAKKIKAQVREKFMMMVKEQKELIQDLVKTAVDSGSAIAAAAQLIAPLSFNIPGAIVLILKVIDAISKIISKVMSIILQLEPLKFLPLLLPKDSFEKASGPLNVVILAIISILDVVGGFQKLISKIMGGLKNATKPENLKSQASKLKSEIEVRKKELADLLKNDKSTQQDIDNKKAEITDLEGRLDIMLKGPNLPEMDDNGQFKERPIEDLLKEIDATLTLNTSSISQLNLQLFDYVYDVRLSDGSIVRGITAEELEYYKEKYVIILDSENSD